MPRRADLVERRNQSILAVGPERYVEVDGGTGGREAQILPVLRDGFPSVLHSQVVPTWGEECRKAGKGNGGEGEEHREQMVAHGHTRPPNGVHLEGERFREHSGLGAGTLREILRCTCGLSVGTEPGGIRMEVGAQSAGFVTELSKPGSTRMVTVDRDVS